MGNFLTNLKKDIWIYPWDELKLKEIKFFLRIISI